MAVGKVFSNHNIVAIDVGTTKIVVLVAAMTADGHMIVTGIGKAPSDGLKKGVVVNIGATVQSIKAAVKEAELMAGITIDSAFIGISGGHIRALNVPGAVPIKKGQVRVADMQNALTAAQAIPLPEGHQILHILPQYFVVDNDKRVIDPLGMHGVRLEVQAHIIMGATASVHDLVTCCEMAGIQAQDIILEPIASAQAVLSLDEQELGTGIIDIGGGTADFAIYQQGSIRHTKIVPIAGTQFTRDIAIGLHTTLEEAERVKRAYATVDVESIADNDLIEVLSIQGGERQKVEHKLLAQIVQARAHELFLLINEEINRYDVASAMTSGVVLTGGGSLLVGVTALATEVFQMPVRVGRPRGVHDIPESLQSPIYATVYGLLLCARNKQGLHAHQPLQEPLVKRIVSSMKSWVADFF
jgi:cell division protein FtsA